MRAGEGAEELAVFSTEKEEKLRLPAAHASGRVKVLKNSQQLN